jgi:hypothetical protein
MLRSIFYARFHPERGPDVLHQYPAGSISRSSSAFPLDASASSLTASAVSVATAAFSSSSARDASILSFPSISAYVIPPHEISNRELAICVQGYRVLGWPVSVEGEGYERNRFVANVCFVIGEEEEEEAVVKCWRPVVGKMARFMRGLEVEGKGGVLRREEMEADARVGGGREQGNENGHEQGGPGGLVGWILKEVYEQLNAYAECCVRVSATQVLNLRLERSLSERSRPRPKKIRAWDVPLLIRELPDPERWTWDLVLEKVRPHVDGVNHVKRIARLADVDLKLVKKAMWELVLHERVLLLDIFHFQAVYALTQDFALFVKSAEVVEECRDYVAIDPRDGMFASVLGKEILEDASGALPDKSTIVELYTILKPGLSVADFCLAHQDLLANIDVRRFITFGVIKGFLKRLHKYALALDPPDFPPVPAPSSGTDLDEAWRKAALSSGWATPPTDAAGALQEKLDAEARARREEVKLVGYLDGKRCLDEVCVEMGMQERRLVERVKNGRFGEVVVFCR